MMFNFKKKSNAEQIESLEVQLRSALAKNEVIEKQLRLYESQVELLRKTLSSKPEDCIQGEYCKNCAFSKFFYMKGANIYVCNKAGSCSHYVPKDSDGGF